MIKMPEGENKLQIPFYRQTLPTSCGASCMLMVGNYFSPENFPLSFEQEHKINEQIRFWKGDEAGELENMAKLLRFARKNGFQVRYFLEGPQKNKIPEGMEESLWKRYLASFFNVLEKERKKKGVTIIEHCNLEDFIEEIVKGRPIICEVQFSGFITHCLVVRGFKGKMFYVIDPLKGYYRMHFQELSRVINLDYMKNAVSLFKA